MSTKVPMLTILAAIAGLMLACGDAGFFDSDAKIIAIEGVTCAQDDSSAGIYRCETHVDVDLDLSVGGGQELTVQVQGDDLESVLSGTECCQLDNSERVKVLGDSETCEAGEQIDVTVYADLVYESGERFGEGRILTTSVECLTTFTPF